MFCERLIRLGAGQHDAAKWWFHDIVYIHPRGSATCIHPPWYILGLSGLALLRNPLQCGVGFPFGLLTTIFSNHESSQPGLSILTLVWASSSSTDTPSSVDHPQTLIHNCDQRNHYSDLNASAAPCRINTMSEHRDNVIIRPPFSSIMPPSSQSDQPFAKHVISTAFPPYLRGPTSIQFHWR